MHVTTICPIVYAITYIYFYSIYERRDCHISVVIDDVSFDEDQWFLANVKHSGFYRVAYDSHTFKQLADQLVENPYVSIHEIVRTKSDCILEACALKCMMFKKCYKEK